MKVIATSDLHGWLPTIKEEADIMVICGDILPTNIQTNMPESEKWLKTIFAYWINQLPVEQVYMIAGNHDFWFEQNGTNLNKIEEVLYRSTNYKLRYLHDTSADYIHTNTGEVFSIYGTPYCKIFGNWAFMKTNDLLEEYFSNIPKGCDILLTHDAPLLANMGMIKYGPHTGIEAGNPILANEILKKKPKYAFCGHIHSGEHEPTIVGDTILANVSFVSEDYKPKHEPLIIEITK